MSMSNFSASLVATAGLCLVAALSSAQVYTQTNESGMNRIAEFRYAADGTLRAPRFFNTGGSGTGMGLGVQSALALSEDRKFLFVVNAGSNDISTFAIAPTGPALVSRTPTVGMRPVSVASKRDLVYVVHGGSATIEGFRLNAFGQLMPIKNSIRPLSSNSAAPGQIAINPEADTVVVSEKNTNKLSYYPLNTMGAPIAVRMIPSAGNTPFGFEFARRGKMLVSEANGGSPLASSVSAYDLDDSGQPMVRSAVVPTFQTAACWLVVSPNGRFAYASNTPSNNLSGFRIYSDGTIMLLNADGISMSYAAGSLPTDMGFRPNGQSLFVLESGRGFVSTSRVQSDGTLVPMGEVGGLPATATGIAVR
jgi:6-phosphogluconolactonase (cycloisomerase 2 family)